MHRRSLMTQTIVAAVISCTILGGVAQSPAPSDANCSDAFLILTGCLSYTAFGSNDTAPRGDCCPELAGLIDSNPICLCVLLAGGTESLGIAVYNARSPPVSLCSDVGIPVSSPTTATFPAPATPTPVGSPSPSAAGNGSQESPESTPASNGQTKLAGGDGAAELVKTAALSLIAIAVTII